MADLKSGPRTTLRTPAINIIARFLRGRARPVTAATIAEKTGLNLSTVRTALGALTGNSTVEVAGVALRQSAGRPANLYKLVD